MTPAPFLDAITEAPPGAAWWVRAADGLRLRVGGWRPERAAGTVLIFPGRTEYIEKYGRPARDFLDAGLAVLAVDWRGQGMADRLPRAPFAGHVRAFADYQRDVAAMLEVAEAQGFPRPFHLLGHSMGGAIGLRALTRGLDVASAVFTAPMWGIVIAPHLRPAAWAVSWAGKRTGLGHRVAPGAVPGCYAATAPFADNTLTTCPDGFAYLQGQLTATPELQVGGPSLAWLHEALLECAALGRAPAPPVPTLVWLGTRERIVDPARIAARAESWPAARLARVEGAEHELLMERPALRAQVMEGTLAHMRAHAG